MKRLSVLTTLFLSAAAIAQSSAILPPANALGFEGTSSTGTLWSATGTGVRQQMIYALGSLPQGKLTITRLRWRANGGATATTGGTWANVTIGMGTSATPYSAPSSTFANNLGADFTTVYSGSVTVQPAPQAFPGLDYVDVTLTTPFVFQAGGDLLIDVVLPSGGYTGGTVTTTDYQIPTGTPASRVYSTTPTNATGSINTSAGIVVTIDYAQDPASALQSVAGYGCYDSALYELFTPAAAFDLSNSGIRLQPNALGGYDVFPVTATFFTPTSAALTMSSGSLDDGVSAQTLPFSFAYPGGSTTAISIATNGFVWLDGTTTTTDFSPAASDLLTQAPRLAVAWTDWNANPTGTGGGGTLHFDVDPSNTAVYATWNGIGAYGWSATYGGPVFSTFQCALFSDGSIEYRYQTVNNPYTPREMMVGIKPGAGTYADPGSLDLSANLPITLSGGTTSGLRVAASARPVLGQSFDVTVSSIPAAATFTALLVNVTSAPGTDLGVVGMPGCKQYVGGAGVFVSGVGFAPPSFLQTFPVPNNMALVGLPLHFQGASLVPGVNPLGGLTSNALNMVIGAF